MFKSINIVALEQKNSHTKFCHKIIDDDFEICISDYPYYIESIMKVYSDKKLNVAKNLYLFYKSNIISNFNGWQEACLNITKNNPPELKYETYLPDIKKYLLLE